MADDKTIKWNIVETLFIGYCCEEFWCGFVAINTQSFHCISKSNQLIVWVDRNASVA